MNATPGPATLGAATSSTAGPHHALPCTAKLSSVPMASAPATPVTVTSDPVLYSALLYPDKLCLQMQVKCHLQLLTYYDCNIFAVCLVLRLVNQFSWLTGGVMVHASACRWRGSCSNFTLCFDIGIIVSHTLRCQANVLHSYSASDIPK